MNPKLVEFALKKQRLQIRAELQRAGMMRHLEGVESVLDTAQRVSGRVRETLCWARDNAPLLSTAVVLVVLLRPRKALRLARRGWLGWLVYRKLGRSIGPLLSAFNRAFGSAARG